MTQHDDLDTATEAAWVGFRRRVADRLATPGDDELVVTWADLPDDTGPGAGSLATLTPLGSGLVGVVAGDDRCTCGPDQAAVVAVRALREQHGVPHPAFLDAEGLEVDPDVAPLRAAVSAPYDDERELEGLPLDREHLVAMVDVAMLEVFPRLQHDPDGDIPIVSGSSVMFVRVLDDRPSVELYAEIVVDPDAPDAEDLLDHELALLNALHPLWKFSHVDGRVHMVHEMVATPFVAATLRTLVRRFVTEVDLIAAGLVVRVGGRRFLEPAPQVDDRDTIMTGLLELLHLDRVRAATVAGLFDHDRIEIIRQIVRVRRGEQSCEGHDEEVVLDALRKALRLVADGAPPAQLAPPVRRTVQEPLLEGLDGLGGLTGLGGDETLDLGWSA
jgi:hypothetical protein